VARSLPESVRGFKKAGSCCGAMVFVDQSAESVARLISARLGCGSAHVEPGESSASPRWGARGCNAPSSCVARSRGGGGRESGASRVIRCVQCGQSAKSSRTPFRAPQANAFAERWIGTVRRDCLDWLLIASRRQLKRVLRVYVDHYNRHTPHRALGLSPPMPARLRLVSSNPPDELQRRDRLGGLIQEYIRAA
jgi:Integrase core domain